VRSRIAFFGGPAWVLLAIGCARREEPPAYAVSIPLATGPGVTTGAGVPAPVPAPLPVYQTGLATWYGQSFAGKKTSNGERFDPRAMTAAHRKLPFGTWVEVRRTETGAAVRVRINDRGPWGDPRRVIDLSQGAAKLLGFSEVGFVKVELRVVDGP
jgi:rare lipoprotein A (peptidoglycan hydrolase)